MVSPQYSPGFSRRTPTLKVQYARPLAIGDRRTKRHPPEGAPLSLVKSREGLLGLASSDRREGAETEDCEGRRLRDRVRADVVPVHGVVVCGGVGGIAEAVSLNEHRLQTFESGRGGVQVVVNQVAIEPDSKV